MARLLAAIEISLLAGTVLACSSAEDSPLPQRQILAVSTCPESRCVSVREAVNELEWAFFEPEALPANFELYSRVLEQDPPTPGATPSEPSFTVLHQFRFQGSENIPGILMVQSRPRGEFASLQPQSEDCGGMVNTGVGPVYYTEGLIRLLPAPDASLWLVCRDDTSGQEQTHSIVLVKDGILLELVAFADSGISKDEFLALVESLALVSGESD